MSGGRGRAVLCDRCGRRIHVNHARNKPVTVCRDCYQTGEYVRLATPHARQRAA